MIREQFINRIQNVYGEPTRVTKKINAWHIFTQFGFVVEVDMICSSQTGHLIKRHFAVQS